MAISEIKVKITIKKWAKPIIHIFVFFGLYPPKWCFSIEQVEVEGNGDYSPD